MNMSTEVAIWAIVPAAGLGSRMESPIPKQYLPIHGKSILSHTLERICAIPAIRRVIVPLHVDDQHWQTTKHKLPEKIEITCGGALRSESVWNALQILSDRAMPQDWILVHDAVRPCILPEEIEKLLKELTDHPVGGLLATRVVDTLKKAKGSEVVATVDREHIWKALTPQVFRYGILCEAFAQAFANNIRITDESSAIEYLGHQPKLCEGSSSNIKITRHEDLAFAEKWLKDCE